MSTYQVTHLNSEKIFTRPTVLYNPHRNRDKQWREQIDPAILAFHRQLPEYAPTPLHKLESVAKELGFRNVYLKDESTRFGLPSFKILGASWAIHRVVCRHLGLSAAMTSFARLKAESATAKASGQALKLVTCTDGNWGRAVARMGTYLDIKVDIYVPGFMSDYTLDLLRREGATVTQRDGDSYDDAIAAVTRAAGEHGALMVLDTSWDGYEEIPKWVTDGYSSIFPEVDDAVGAVENVPKLVIASVGVGSWAHAVVQHYRAESEDNILVTAEPETAASFKESLHCSSITPIRTGSTIMDGMNCGTTSTIAWPVLRDGVDTAIAVTDRESHAAVEELKGQGVKVGPCGAATLAALRKVCRAQDPRLESLNRGTMDVIMFSTEGWREYRAPKGDGV